MYLILKSLVFSLSICVFNISFADGGNPGGKSQYSHLPDAFDKAIKSIEAEDYSMAIKQLESLENTRPNDPDVFNLLGYSHRKSNDFTFAEEYYLKALAVDPKHKGTNHYIGVLYLQTDRLDQAEQRLKVLKKASFLPNKQYRDLKKAIREYKKQNS